MIRLIALLVLGFSQVAFADSLKIHEIVSVKGFKYFCGGNMRICFEALDGSKATHEISISPLDGDFTLEVQTKLFGQQSLKINMEGQQFIDTVQLAMKSKQDVHFDILKQDGKIFLESVVIGK